MEKSINQLITEIKENNEDYEFYPTTEEIVDKLASKLKEDYYSYGSYMKSILDIGCGNGSFFKKLENKVEFSQKYGIEKSTILYEQLPDDVVLLGSDFNEQTLIDKKVDVIFCNPPYSEFEEWTEKIILQGNADIISLVIPERWKNSERIKEAIKKRGYTVNVLGTYNFSNAERTARATVDLLYIDSTKEFRGKIYHDKCSDPFDVWFDETFSIDADKDKRIYSDYDRKEEIKNELVKSGDTAEVLVEFYNKDMEKLYSNYRALEKLDADIFEELKVDVASLKKSLKMRLQGLKNVYWDLLFQRYDKITTRLTAKGKSRVLDRLNNNTSIDFTLQNIFMVTMWVIKHANSLMDEQLVDFFYKVADFESIQRYKSNLRWNDSDWRYVKEAVKESAYKSQEDRKNNKYLKNIKLDYRIVVKGWSNFTWEYNETKFSEIGLDFLNDLFAIAYNLGFVIQNKLPGYRDVINIDDWKNFDLFTTDGKLFANVKLYQNGNKHIKFCKEFMQKFNVEMARINGWIHDKKEAEIELDMTAEEVERVWNKNQKIMIESSRSILGIEEDK